MKNLRIALFLLAVPITSAAAMAQTSGTPQERPSPRVTQAHCQYTPSDAACQHPRQTNPQSGQCLQSAPCRSECCPYGYPPTSRPPFLFEPENGTHVAAGALIGFGLGAALGVAKDGDAGSRFAGAMVVGGFGALIGAVIGHGIPARPWHRHRPYWDDPGENAVNPRPNPSTGPDPSATGSERQPASSDGPSGP